MANAVPGPRDRAAVTDQGDERCNLRSLKDCAIKDDTHSVLVSSSEMPWTFIVQTTDEDEATWPERTTASQIRLGSPPTFTVFLDESARASLCSSMAAQLPSTPAGGSGRGRYAAMKRSAFKLKCGRLKRIVYVIYPTFDWTFCHAGSKLNGKFFLPDPLKPWPPCRRPFSLPQRHCKRINVRENTK